MTLVDTLWTVAVSTIAINIDNTSPPQQAHLNNQQFMENLRKKRKDWTSMKDYRGFSQDPVHGKEKLFHSM